MMGRRLAAMSSATGVISWPAIFHVENREIEIGGLRQRERLLEPCRLSRNALADEFLDEASCITRSAVVQRAPVLQPSSEHAIAVTKTNEPAREQLIHRRWLETGIKMWNPDHHGAGHAALNIQGQAELLPPKPGETLPEYDTLEFKIARSCVTGQEVDHIVCEGVVVEPPKRRAERLTTGAAVT